MLKELRIEASMAYHDKDFKETVDAFVAGELPFLRPLYVKNAHVTPGKFKGIEKMVTSRIYIDDITTKGFEELVTNKDQHIKIMVTTQKDKL